MIYFAYGSNMDHVQMQVRCPGQEAAIGVARLAGYALAFTRWSRSWNSGTADILPERMSEVWGVLYDLTLDNLRRMDQFADYPNSYVRQDIFLEYEGETIPSFTYVAIRQGIFAPSKSYVNKMIMGAEENHIPESYIVLLKSLPTHD
jgi:hypothetical protein